MNPRASECFDKRSAYAQRNRAAWNELARAGCDSSVPFGTRQISNARALVDPFGWLPWNDIRSVLCLASGGGQQALLFASLGYDVVSVDLSEEQLRRDLGAATREGVAVECVQADMLDISVLGDAKFDLVYQAVSTCYVPDVRRLYGQVRAHLNPAGFYWSEHWNPVHLQLAETRRWQDGAYRLTTPQTERRPLPWPDGKGVHFIHSVGDLVGGLCEAGFAIIGLSDMRSSGELDSGPGSGGHLERYLPPFLTIFAKRRSPDEE